MAEIHYTFEGQKKIRSLGTTTRMGRSPENDFCVLDTELSRCHAIISELEKKYILSDEDSRNGIYYEGQRVSRLVLRDGMEFVMGLGTYVFVHPQEDALIFTESDAPVAVAPLEPEDVAEDEFVLADDDTAEREAVAAKQEFQAEIKMEQEKIAVGETQETRVVPLNEIPNMRNIGQGSVFGGAVIEQGINRSGIGHVFRAQQKSLVRTVAIKVIDTRFSVEPSFAKHMDLIVGHVKSIDHPHLVKVIENGEQDGYFYFVKEWVEGRSTAEMLQLEARLDQVLTGKILSTIVDVLRYLKSAGTVHGNIRPSNVLVRSDQYIKILSTGLSQLVPASVREEFRDQFDLPYFQSPEQIRGETITIASDMYSLGATLYYLLTGRYVFLGNTFEEVARQHLESQPILLTKYDDSISPDLEGLVLALLSKDPQERPTPEDISVAVDDTPAPAPTPLPPAPAVTVAPPTFDDDLQSAPTIAVSPAEQQRRRRKAPVKAAVKSPVKAKSQQSQTKIKSKSAPSKFKTQARTRRTRKRLSKDEGVNPAVIVVLLIVALGCFAAVMLVGGGEADNNNKDAMKKIFERNSKPPTVRYKTKVVKDPNKESTAE